MKAMCQLVTMSLAVLAFMSTPSAARTTCSSSNVTTVVHDYDSSGAQLLLRSDDYNGTGQAAYSAALDANLSSTVYCGQWYLRMYSQSVRTLWITPNDAINSSQPAGPPPGYYWQDVEAASGCSDQNGNTVPLENILTSSNNCELIVDFYSGATKYKLAMGPSWSAPGAPTGLVTVTCNSVSSGQCVNWTFTPNMTTGSANPATVANLYYYAKGGKLTFIGHYYNTFRFGVTNP